MVYEAVGGSGDQVAAWLIERLAGAGIVWLAQPAARPETAASTRHGEVALDRPDILRCTVNDDDEAGWAAEEALRTRGVGLVVVELADHDAGCHRRLARAAALGGGIGLVLSPEPRRPCSTSLPDRMRSDDPALAVAPTGQPARRSVPAAAPARWKAAFA